MNLLGQFFIFYFFDYPSVVEIDIIICFDDPSFLMSTEGGKALLATPEVGASTETSEWAMQGEALLLKVYMSDAVRAPYAFAFGHV